MKPKKHILSLLMILVMVFSCAAGAAGEAAEDIPVLNDGTPWIDYCLRENITQAEEKPDSPKDDFYLWANYDWLKTAEIKPGDATADIFTAIEKEIMAQCLEVLNDPMLQSEDAAIAQYLYRAWLDWDARDALGVRPLTETIERINAVSTIDELTRLLCDETYPGTRLIRYDVDTGRNDPDKWIVNVLPTKLMLNDSAEYLNRTEQGDFYESIYRRFFPAYLEKAGCSREEADEMLTRTFALETELADSIFTSAETMSPDYERRANNEMSRAEAEALCGAFPLLEILDAGGYGAARSIQVEQPAYLQKLDRIYREDHLEDLKNYLIIRTATNLMSVMDRESFDLYIAINNTMFGIAGTRPDEEEACTFVREQLPSQMDRAFLEKFDASKMKADITRICEETIDCYRTMLGEEKWLTEETRAKAVEKLDAMQIVAVYPEKWPDYSGLRLEGLGLYDCFREIGRYRDGISAALADQPVDRDLWYYTLDNDWANDILVTNAMNNPYSNAIVIPRGILGRALYREDMSDEELCGGIGLIIAHEISHSFDPTGSQYDALGRMSSWWTDEDRTAFSARAQRLIDYYNGMTVFNGMKVKGESVQGEAVADMGGMKCMLSLLEKRKGDVDYRAFFEAVAECWRGVITWEAQSYMLTQDPHPVNYLRVNTLVQQFEQFHETYGITEGDGMWLAPEDRVQVW